MLAQKIAANFCARHAGQMRAWWTRKIMQKFARGVYPLHDGANLNLVINLDVNLRCEAYYKTIMK